METNIRSLLGAFSRILNLINRDMQYHHEQTGYLAYKIGKEMGLSEEELFLALNAALLHDIGDVVEVTSHSFVENQEEWHEAETREERRRIARIGANMLRDIDGFRSLADIVEVNQDAYSDFHSASDSSASFLMNRIAQIVHLADYVAADLNTDTPVLNQVKRIVSVAEEYSGTEFCPEVVAAFKKISSMECMWMDLSINPVYMLSHLGPLRIVPLDELVIFTSLISRIIDFRSPFTAMHSAGVAATAGELARLAGMSDDDVMMMEAAGNLHDIGKLRVPNSILEKPGKLTDEEFNVMKEHSYYTNAILQDVDGFEKITQWAAYHHEKLNGKGYPFHLKKEDLDEGSRIMAVADIFSAIAEVRPYRAGMSKEQAIKVLEENAASGEICPEIVALLIDHYDEVDAVREQRSRVVGRHYYESLGMVELAGE